MGPALRSGPGSEVSGPAMAWQAPPMSPSAGQNAGQKLLLVFTSAASAPIPDPIGLFVVESLSVAPATESFMR
ncbi:hypothetical protein VTI74DRAFT_1630 [Chaetomium olivicolor]